MGLCLGALFVFAPACELCVTCSFLNRIHVAGMYVSVCGFFWGESFSLCVLFRGFKITLMFR